MEKTGQSNRHILLKILLVVIMFAICFLITQFVEQRYAIRQEIQGDLWVCFERHFYLNIIDVRLFAEMSWGNVKIDNI